MSFFDLLIGLFYFSRGLDLFIALAVFLVVARWINHPVFRPAAIFVMGYLLYTVCISYFFESSFSKYANTDICIFLLSIIYINNEEKFSLEYIYFAGLFCFFIWIACIVGFIPVNIFEKYLLSGFEASQFSGIVRFYSIFAISFVLLPIPVKKQKLYLFIGMMLSISTLSIMVIGVYSLKIFFTIRRNLSFQNIYIYLIILISLLIVSFSEISDLIIDQKIHSLNTRLSKLLWPNLFGTLYDSGEDDFSESILLSYIYHWGLIPGLIFFGYFFKIVYKRSNSVFYTITSILLLLTNPFPLALIYLYSNLREKNNEKFYSNFSSRG